MISLYTCANMETSELTELSAKVGEDHKTVNSILLLSPTTKFSAFIPSFIQARSLTPWTLSAWFLKWFKCLNSSASSLHFGWLHNIRFTPPSCCACALRRKRSGLAVSRLPHRITINSAARLQ